MLTSNVLGVIGGVPEQPDACFGEVATDFHKQQGIINAFITRNISMQSPLMRLGMMTKTQFPANQGDIYRKVILTATRATSAAGKNWSPLKAAYPGGPVPTCRTPQVIRYGHTTTQSCLERFSLRTDDFNAVDLTFQTRRAQQWAWVTNTILPGWSLDTQKFWYREAYRRTVWNVVCGEDWRQFAQMGEFSPLTKPSSILTADFLDEFHTFLQGWGANQTPYTSVGDGMLYHVLVTGADEFRAIDEQDRAANAALGVRYNDAIVIPGYGKLRTIRNYVIFVEDDIPRLGVNDDGTYREIDESIEVNVAEGTESQRNPDYDNPAVALYTESFIWNISAAEWYIPPNFTQFPEQKAGDWNGSFSLINIPTKEDPLAENAWFLADFAFGIGPNVEPRRGMVILSKAVHRRGRNVCAIVGQQATFTSPTIYGLKNVTIDAYTSRFNFEANVAIPSSCPAQYSLYLTTQRGLRAKIATVYLRQEASLPFQYSVALEDTELSTTRDCDPWVSVACLPDYEPTTVSVNDDCLTCSDTSLPVCDFVAEIESTAIRNIRLKDGTQLNDESGFNFPYESGDIATLDTDLTTWLALTGNGGGAVAVAFDDGTFTVTITGTEAKFGQLVGDAGALPFTKSNCVAAE